MRRLLFLLGYSMFTCVNYLHGADVVVNIREIEIEEVYKDGVEHVLKIESSESGYIAKDITRERTAQRYKVVFFCDLMASEDLEIEAPSPLEILNQCRWYLDDKRTVMYNLPDTRDRSVKKINPQNSVKIKAGQVCHYNFRVDFLRENGERFALPDNLYYMLQNRDAHSCKRLRFIGAGNVRPKLI